MQTEVDSHHASGLVQPKGQERKGTQNLACVTSVSARPHARAGRWREKRGRKGTGQPASGPNDEPDTQSPQDPARRLCPSVRPRSKGR